MIAALFVAKNGPYFGLAGELSRAARSNRRARERGMRALEYLSRKGRAATPAEFRNELVKIARGVHG